MDAKSELTYKTMCLVFDMLKQKGFRPTNEGDDIIRFNIYDDQFEAQFNGLTVTFWDVSWAWINQNSPNYDEFTKAVNFSNLGSPATLIYTEPNDEGIVRVHTKHTVIFEPKWEGNEDILDYVFESFNRSREEMNRLYFSKLNHNQG